MPPPIRCCIGISQDSLFHLINKSGARVWIDSCTSSGALVLIFNPRDSIIKVDTLPNKWWRGATLKTDTLSAFHVEKHYFYLNNPPKNGKNHPIN